MFFMHWGWIAKPIFNPPYVGVFLEGFLTNGDYRTIFANALQLVLAVAPYWPFFKVMERAELKLEAKKPRKVHLLKEDEDTLAGLDLDF